MAGYPYADLASCIQPGYRYPTVGTGVNSVMPRNWRHHIVICMRLWSAALVLVLTGCGGDQHDTAAARIALGQALFHDMRLSADGKTSCASCHRAELAYTDGAAVSTGTGGQHGTRNAPSLLDSRFMTHFFWDGRAATLEEAVLQPLTNPREMGLADRQAVLAHLARDPRYASLLHAAAGEDDGDIQVVAAALATYIRALPAPPTRYETYRTTHGARASLSEDEREGLALFSGKAGCVDCHRLDGTPATTSDQRFHHAGIGFNQVAGNVAALLDVLERQKREGRSLGDSILSDVRVAEMGRFAVTRAPQDLGAFRTPSLRTVADTAPYMHDGSIVDLPAAVEHEVYYRNLARNRPISLTAEEKHKLVLFLQALSSTGAAPR
ncbi:cytochrome-c peroxidase [Xanthomonas sacchari]|uniref:cytochrome-c peroxidase n=2 Tax=Xanthomonas TaxID=338 RepID=UPI0022593FA3|nr:cytochrome c peroxidase [Xanthomonas sacchari]